MKKLYLVLLCAAAGWLIPANDAHAIQLFYTKFEAKYAGASANADFAKLVKETKCNVCHVKEMEKKVRNEFGMALKAAGLEKGKYTKERIEAEADAVDKEVNAAFEKVMKEKSKAGPTYGELIKAGKLPG